MSGVEELIRFSMFLVAEVLEVHVTDKGAAVDFPAWANAGGHEILEQTDDAGVLKIFIKKA